MRQWQQWLFSWGIDGFRRFQDTRVRTEKRNDFFKLHLAWIGVNVESDFATAVVLRMGHHHDRSTLRFTERGNGERRAATR